MKRPAVYYMSEMNVSDHHGGGLTLQRILGDDLEKFDGFLQLFEFKGKFPTNAKCAKRELNLWKVVPPFTNYKMPERFSKDYFVNHYKRIFKLPNPKYLDYDHRNAWYYKELQDKVTIERSKFLIVPQHFQSVLFTNFLFKKHKIDYGAWVMDDHLLKYSASKGFHYTGRFEQHYRTFLRNAKLIFVISENMQAFYKQRFDVDSVVLFGPSDVNGHTITGRSPGDVIRFCYFGALWKWQEDAIDKLISILPQINATLDIYTFHKVKEEIGIHPRVKMCEPVEAGRVKKIMSEYDGVVIPFGFDEDVRALSSLNISTKLSECLASGVPTVLVGPEFGAMAQFAKKHRCAIVLSDVHDAQQIQTLKATFQPDKREALLKQAQWVAENITSTIVMQQVWKNSWEKILGN